MYSLWSLWIYRGNTMKLTNWSVLGIIFGILLFIATEIRYFVLYPDLDKALYFGIISILIVAISWHHSSITNLSRTLDDVETYLADKNEKIQEPITD